MKKPFNQVIIKYILITVMTLDHISGYLGPEHPLYLPFRIISRLTGPTMAYFLAEGFYYTKNVKKYALRLLLFAFISSIPYSLVEFDDPAFIRLVEGNVIAERFIYLPNIDKTLIFNRTSVIFDLFLSLSTLIIWDKTKLPIWVKIIITALFCWISLFCDWWFMNILYCLSFYYLRDKKVGKWVSYALLSCLYIFNIYINTNPFNPILEPKFCLYRIGNLLVIPFVTLLYNGKQGKRTFFNKWLFYIYYPIHFIIIYLIFHN